MKMKNMCLRLLDILEFRLVVPPLLLIFRFFSLQDILIPTPYYQFSEKKIGLLPIPEC